MSRWIYEFSAIDPRDHSRTWTVGIQERHYRTLQHHGHEKHIARLLLVKETLDDPIRLYQGWSRQDKDDCYVYAGLPAHDFRSLSIELPPPPNQFFLVFVLPGGTIDEWNWRSLDEITPDLPQGVEGEVIWQRPMTT